MHPLPKSVLAIFVFLASMLSSCYEDYLIIFTKVSEGIYSKDSTKIFFFHEIKAGQPPKGISRLPDGGKHKIVFKRNALYAYDITTKTLRELYRYDSMPASMSSWHMDMDMKQSKLVFAVHPVSGWNWMKEHSVLYDYHAFEKKHAGIFIYDQKSISRLTKKGYTPKLSSLAQDIIFQYNDSSTYYMMHINSKMTEPDTLRIFHKLEKYALKYNWVDSQNILYTDHNQTYMLNIKSKEVRKTDLVLKKRSNTISFKEMHQLTQDLPSRDFGLQLLNIWPGSRKDYVQHISHLEGNFAFRKTILEQITPSLSAEEKTKLLEQIDAFVNEYTGAEKMKMEMIAKDTKQYIKSLEHAKN